MQRTKILILYYSATGHIYQLAKAMQEAALESGAEVRLRKVKETASAEAIEKNEAWKKHLEEANAVNQVELTDLEWADGFAIGTPTRFGGMAAQLKAFIDTTGGLWYAGKLSNKTVTSFTSAGNPHGGQEATLISLNNIFYHWGNYIIPPGYTDPAVFAAGGNPYGTSATANRGGEMDEATLNAARHQMRRLITATTALVSKNEEELLHA